MSDGTRTRGILDHNQVLYQLSYTHHDRSLSRPAEKKCTGSERVLAPAFTSPCRGTLARATPPYSAVTCVTCSAVTGSAGTTWRAAMVLAVSESGPGCGTKIASR